MCCLPRAVLWRCAAACSKCTGARARLALRNPPRIVHTSRLLSEDFAREGGVAALVRLLALWLRLLPPQQDIGACTQGATAVCLRRAGRAVAALSHPRWCRCGR